MKYLSRKDIEAIGERVTKAYFRLPDLTGKTVYKITPDKLITDLLGVNLEYHHLSLDGSVLGLTSSNLADIFFIPAYTIIANLGSTLLYSLSHTLQRIRF